MDPKKIITIFGATGAQGGGLAHAILQDKNSSFAVRAVTRDINSDKAKALGQLGAEVVAADIDVPQSVENALRGAYGAFFVTFFWAHFSAEKEKAEAAIFVEAARRAELKHVIWSTLEDTRDYVPLTDQRMPTLHARYKVPHFDGKGESDKLFTAAGIPTTFMLASFYWDNFIYFGAGPKRGEDGKLALTLPIGNSKMAGIAAEDIGKCAYGIFKRGTEMVGKRIGIAGEQLTGNQMADELSKALGEQVVYNKIPADVYRGFGFPGADDLGNMYQFYDEFEKELNNTRDVDRSKQLNPDLMNFAQWLKKYAGKIPL
ncbi:nucleoside-diphosphate sugar epimerase [Niastella yeongjuensis]|uniref:Nucleoside-diphosphate sugar epimerase n=1 Tax=Niastella yeongjuensis TaxID=354355 RepID=A0A1V9F794_9BACT|nr:NmrA/HSCARG family protein [Niastella yeongjuensis]OQP54279.1 nucleoside-diphosphate sugar epimerase [Niastella yeongjuensis]SEP30912.1 Uncharacterized conserved protein YbjT, contains NAD(P)-binding and DUF2867 domains [Niastella yeongjuensis]